MSTNEFELLVPAHVRTLRRHAPGKPVKQAERESGVQCIKLASNENPFGPSPRAVAAMQAVLGQANFYPDDSASDLRGLLATRHGLAPEQVIVTAGSTDLLGILARTLLAPGLNAVTSQLSFIQYAMVTQAGGATLVQVPLRDDGFDLDGIAAAITPETRIVFLANPNNPTGTMFSAAALDRFLARMPEHVLVVIDEAYFDFAEHFAKQRGVEYSHALDYVRQGRKVIVLRTFSKAHGLAGVRAGYGMAHADLISYLVRMRPTFSVSAVAQAAAIAAVADEAHIRRTVENNATGVARLQAAISAMGYRVIPTWANFVYLETGEDAMAVARRLQDAEVIVRPMTPWGAPTAIRVTAGTPEQNEVFLKAFKKAMKKLSD